MPRLHIRKHAVTFLIFTCLFVSNKSSLAEQEITQSLDKLSTNELINKAEQNDKNAQFKLGIRYADGRKAKKDNDKATHWLKKAAKQNHIPALTKLGMIDLDIGNFDSAFKWFNEAAQKNDPHAQAFLGTFYEKGIGVPANSELAFTWYEKAATQGIPSAQYIMGRIYKDKDSQEDLQTAISWYKKSAEKGSADAMTQLGIFYMRGQGVPRNINNIEHSIKWFQQASLQGQPLAQLSLGLIASKTSQSSEGDIAAYTLLYAATKNNPFYFKKPLDYDKDMVESLLVQANRALAQLEKKLSNDAIKQAHENAKQFSVGSW